MIYKADSIEIPDYKILDLDSTNLSTYGHQEGSKFNYHYKAVGYYPLVMFDGMTKDFVELNKEMDELGKEIGVVISIQHENIFDSMHRI